MSEFWIRKMKTYFRCIDLNKCGTLTKDDFVEIGKRFAELNKLDEEFINIMESQIIEIWRGFAKGNVNMKLTEDKLIESAKTGAFSDPAYASALRKGLEFAFAVADANGDGNIRLEEYKSLFGCFDITGSIASVSFKDIDADGDGVISLDEYVTSGLAFFLSEQENHPGQLFWGPLI